MSKTGHIRGWLASSRASRNPEGRSDGTLTVVHFQESKFKSYNPARKSRVRYVSYSSRYRETGVF